MSIKWTGNSGLAPIQVMSLCACLDKQDVLLQACNLGARSCAAALYVY